MDYSGKNILIAGGLGFLGLNLVRALRNQNVKIKILAPTLHPLSVKWLGEISEGMQVKIYQGEIQDAAFMQEFLDGGDIIFNFAGRSGAAKSLVDASLDMSTNIAGHLNVLETLRKLGQNPRIVFVSSRLVYGVTGAQAVTEDCPLNPTSIYGLHKLTAEHYYRLYSLHYGIPYTIMRLTNPYGPYQDPKRKDFGIVNRFIVSAIRNERLEIYGNGSQLRDYIYVEDVIDALLKAALASVGANKIWNLGSGNSITLEEMAAKIIKLTGSGYIQKIAWPSTAQKVETGDFKCDICHISNALNWKPKFDIDSGLLSTIRVNKVLLENAEA